jgi:pimeloyl-ACP methyl ester carboxylesterase
MLPILFLHGWGTNSASFTPILNFFKTQTTCITVDFDCNPAVVMTLNDYVDIAERELIKNKVTKCHIIAHSFGARVAVLLALRNPHIIERMCLTGAAGLKPRFNLKRFIKIKLYKIFKIGHGSADYKILSTTGKQTFKNIIMRDLHAEIKQVSQKTLLIFGKKDKSTPIYMAKRWTKAQKQSILKIYPSAGHCAFLDNTALFVTDAYKFLGGG